MNKILAGKVRMSKWGWLMAMGTSERNKTLAGRVGMSNRGC